ncbi:MAG: hypothetical protein HAW59_01285 [Betaproteobacteria bacterium]|nr:hypothetical protein [Betaproteobacteria bacterium]
MACAKNGLRQKPMGCNISGFSVVAAKARIFFWNCPIYAENKTGDSCGGIRNLKKTAAAETSRGGRHAARRPK